MIQSRIKSLWNAIMEPLRRRRQLEQLPGFFKAFEAENQRLAAARVKAISILGIICFAGVGLIDWAVYPHLAPTFTITRAIFIFLTGLSFALSSTDFWKRHALKIIFLNGLLGDLIVAHMTSQISGWSALYFTGFVLVTTGLAMFVPWRPRTVFFYSLCSMTIYVTVNRIYHPFSIETLIPLTFLVVVGAQAYVSALSNEISRMEQFASKIEIERSHHELQTQSDLLQKQIEAAKDIQQALLPPMKQNLKGFQIDAIYEPSAHLSGDFFDAIPVGDWVYVYLSDVTGHGLPAAQITFLVKEIFKAALSEERELQDLFDEVRRKYVDHQLAYDLGLQIVRIHTRTLQMECLKSNAPNPVQVDQAGQAQELDVPASPSISATVGSADGQKARIVSEVFDGTKMFFLHSDGAYEFKTASGREFGHRRLMKAFASTRGEFWPEGLAKHLKSENCETDFPDDLTVLRIQLHARGST